MTASKPTVLELAKQGDARAIAALMNRYLKPKGITATTALENGCLQVWLESERLHNRPTLVEFIRRGVTNLKVDAIKTVKLCGVQTGEPLPVWKEEINLEPPVDSANLISQIEPEPASEPEPYLNTGSVLTMDSISQDDVGLPESKITQRPRTEISSQPVTESDKKQGINAMLSRNWKVIAKLVAMTVVAAAVGFLSVVLIGTLWKQSQTASQLPESPSDTESQPAATDPAQPSSPSSQTAQSSPSPATASDPKAVFNQALEIALSAAVKTQTAQSRADWETVVSEWQEAIDLLGQVPVEDSNYTTAQQKISQYQRNLAYAQGKVSAAQ